MSLKKVPSRERIAAILLFVSLASAQGGEHQVRAFVTQLPLVRALSKRTVGLEKLPTSATDPPKLARKGD